MDASSCRFQFEPRIDKKTDMTWVFPKIVGFSPQIIPFVHRVFHYFHHTFWGVSLFLETPTWTIESWLVWGVRILRENQLSNFFSKPNRILSVIITGCLYHRDPYFMVYEIIIPIELGGFSTSSPKKVQSTRVKWSLLKWEISTEPFNVLGVRPNNLHITG